MKFAAVFFSFVKGAVLGGAVVVIASQLSDQGARDVVDWGWVATLGKCAMMIYPKLFKLSSNTRTHYERSRDMQFRSS